MKKKIGLAVSLVIVILAVIVVWRTLHYPSRQLAGISKPVLDIDKAKAAERLAGMIRFPTISHDDGTKIDKESFLALHRYLEQAFPLVHQKLTREVVSDLSLLYTWQGSDSSLPPVLMLAHQDVVSIESGSEREWSYPPFSGAIVDGVIWGRGTLDYKVGISAALEAAEYLIAAGFQPKRTIYLAFGHDEETGGRHGAAAISALLLSRGIRLEWVLDEGSVIVEGKTLGVSSPVALVGIAEKGNVSLELSCKSSGGHSAMPPAHTSVGILSAAICELEKHPFPARIGGTAKQMFAYLGPESPFMQKLFLANQWLFKPLLVKVFTSRPESAAIIRTTTAATIFQAGVKNNVIPQQARAVVNFRIIPGQKVEDVIAYVRKTIANAEIEVKPIDLFSRDPSTISEVECPAFVTLHRTIKELFPEAVVSPYLAITATDSSYFYSLSNHVYRFLALPMAKSDLARIHGTDECLKIADYGKYIAFLVQLIKNSQSK